MFIMDYNLTRSLETDPTAMKDRVESLRLGLSRPSFVSFTLFRSTNLRHYFLDDLHLVVCPGDRSGQSQAIK
jgi:hypothetical protein